MQIDTQANVLQALESKRVDAAAVDLSTVRWLASRNPDKYFDAGKSWFSMLYGAALRQGDLDWLTFVNTDLHHRHVRPRNGALRRGVQGLLRQEPPAAHPGFPVI